MFALFPFKSKVVSESQSQIMLFVKISAKKISSLKQCNFGNKKKKKTNNRKKGEK